MGAEQASHEAQECEAARENGKARNASETGDAASGLVKGESASQMLPVSAVGEQDDPEARIRELEAQVEDLMRQIVKLRRSIVDWHSAIFGALNLVLKQYRHGLEIEREHLLNLMPRRIDYLVLKKDPSLVIELDAFRLFREHNIVEAKSYEDALDRKVIWSVISYAAQYLEQQEPADSIPADQVTVTIIRSAFPRKLLRQLRDDGWTVEEKYQNIFYLSGGVRIPIQIVVTKDLGEAYIPLQILTGRAKEEDVRRFVAYRESLTDRADREFADAVMAACVEANRELFQKIRKEDDMHSVLRELLKDDLLELQTQLQEAIQRAEQEALEKQAAQQKAAEETANTLKNVAVRLIQTGADGTTIATATGYDRSRIDSIAKRMNRTVRWNVVN